MKQLYRTRQNIQLAGVCGGVGEYMEIDPSVIRLLWIVLTAMTGILIYITAAFVIPHELKH